jgi:uncharacterized protein YyaL (SSP411 family)
MPENRLANSTSPYLQQHKDNPVDWHPWGEEAFALAQETGRPILLSVGYAACHWCHVMAHESFENEETAALMNQLFVNVKVDREERPDVDSIYQSALAILTRQAGGWPLTMFLNPAGEPFWGGTYFPPEDRYGRAGFPGILRRISEIYRERKDDVAQNATALRTALSQLATAEPAGELPLSLNLETARRLAAQFDPLEGGLAGAPKFPQPPILKLLWKTWAREGDSALKQAVELTLRRMSQGGIYDHLGGGYARYSVDAKWLVPHFEKMLYDNAQILDLLTLAAQANADPLFTQRAAETVEWMLREMQAPESPDGGPCGGFASSLDADSEGEEGLFYVWTEAEIDRALGEDAPAFKAAYDVTAAGNWEGRTILNRSRQPKLGDESAEARLAANRKTLLALRAERVRPGWDDKVLADWNGLTIAALARAALGFGRPDWLAPAEKAFAFAIGRMSLDGRLKHAWRHGTLDHPATLDDYANLCLAALALHEATGQTNYLEPARAWVAILDKHYWDGGAGGYFLTADDTPALIVRPKTAQDNATPAGNGVMVEVLARLHHLTGEAAYARRAEALVAAFAGSAQQSPFAFPTLLAANALLRDATQVVVMGERGTPDTEDFLKTIYSSDTPDIILHVVGRTSGLPEIHSARGKRREGGRVTAYICRGTTCSLPITDLEAFRQALAQ